MRKRPEPDQIYKHFKGKYYQIITLAKHTETEEEMVVYRALYGTYGVYVRPLSMFMEEVDRTKYPDVLQKYRFSLMEEEKVTEDLKEENQAEEKAEEGKSESYESSLLEAYFDASSYKERLELLDKMEPYLTEHMLSTMAVIHDFELSEGSIQEKLQDLKKCLQTRERFEQTRLR